MTPPISCFLSATGIRFLGLPVPAEELSFPRSRPTGHRDPDSNGISTFRTSETRPGWVPSLSRGGGVLLAGVTSTSQRLPLLNGQPCTPLPHSVDRAWDHETSSRVHLHSPVRSSP